MAKENKLKNESLSMTNASGEFLPLASIYFYPRGQGSTGVDSPLNWNVMLLISDNNSLILSKNFL